MYTNHNSAYLASRGFTPRVRISGRLRFFREGCTCCGEFCVYFLVLVCLFVFVCLFLCSHSLLLLFVCVCVLFTCLFTHFFFNCLIVCLFVCFLLSFFLHLLAFFCVICFVQLGFVLLALFPLFDFTLLFLPCFTLQQVGFVRLLVRLLVCLLSPFAHSVC